MNNRFPLQKFGKKGFPLLITLAGFPDDCTSGWGVENLETLSKEYRVVSLCLPGYDKPGRKIRSWGWDTHEVMAILHFTIEEILAEEKADGFNFMVHDWGAFYGMCYQNAHPEHIKKMIIFDIGVVKKPPTGDALRIVFYQIWFAVAFFITQLPPSAFFRWIGDLCMVLYNLLFSWTPICPTNEQLPRGILNVTALQCYPYYYFWLGPSGFIRLGPKKMLRPRTPDCPTLFFYGKKKNLMFHSEDFLTQIRNREDSSVVTMPNSGHWMMTTREDSEVVIKEILAFVE